MRLTLGFDLGLSLRRDAGSLGLGLLTELGEDLRSVGAGGLADLRGLGASVGQLRGVFRQCRIGLGLGAIRLGDVALDGFCTGIQQFPEPRHADLPEEEQDDRGSTVSRR